MQQRCAGAPSQRELAPRQIGRHPKKRQMDVEKGKIRKGAKDPCREEGEQADFEEEQRHRELRHISLAVAAYALGAKDDTDDEAQKENRSRDAGLSEEMQDRTVRIAFASRRRIKFFAARVHGVGERIGRDADPQQRMLADDLARDAPDLPTLSC